MTWVRLSWVAGVALCAVLLPAGNAFGHAAFVGSQPAPGVRLDEAPQRVVLTFTAPLNRRLSRATLVRPDGESVAIEVQAASEQRLVVRPAGPLDTGAYRVRWHTVSTQDGHALEGSFSFGVRAPAVGGEHDLEQSPLARNGWIRVSLRALLYVAVLLLAAGLVLPLLVRASPSWLAPAALEREVREAPAVRLREQRLVGDLAWLSVAAAVAATLAEAADAAGGLSLAGVRDFLLSGSAGGARVATVLALIAAAGLLPRRPRWAVASVALALWGIALSGHAGSATPRISSVANDWLHLASGAVWLGGIGLLGLVWTPALRRGGRPVRQAVARHVLPAFGRVALPAFLLVVTTGVVSLVTQLGHLDALWTTAYGRVLLVKIALVGVIAAASAAHAWRFRPRVLADATAAASRSAVTGGWCGQSRSSGSVSWRPSRCSWRSRCRRASWARRTRPRPRRLPATRARCPSRRPTSCRWRRRPAVSSPPGGSAVTARESPARSASSISGIDRSMRRSTSWARASVAAGAAAGGSQRLRPQRSGSPCRIAGGGSSPRCRRCGGPRLRSVPGGCSSERSGRCVRCAACGKWRRSRADRAPTPASNTGCRRRTAWRS